VSAPAAKAVVLARGLGTRMRRPDTSAALDRAQTAAAAAGLKAMMPVGRPFLDYVLAALAEAGYTDACLVVGPEHGAVRQRYLRDARPTRLRLGFAIQARPLGTADAVLAAEGFAGADPFAVVNADNYYPLEALRTLRAMEGAGLAAFWREALIREGNLDLERALRFPVVDADPDGWLARLIEPGDPAAPPGDADALVSMNCWRFTTTIFRACRAIRPAPSGELELPEAVRHAVRDLGERLRVVPLRAPVLDLTRRADVAAVAARLRDAPAFF
jgi:dTDP-glucose pyrophosphorylase